MQPSTLFNPLRGMHYGKYWRPFVWSVWRVWFGNLRYELRYRGKAI